MKPFLYSTAVVLAEMMLLSVTAFSAPMRRWEIKSASSTVIVELMEGAGRDHAYYSLVLKSLADGSITTSEEADCLNQVLGELPSMEVDAAKISLIYLPQIGESDVKASLIESIAAANRAGKSLPIKDYPSRTLIGMLNSADAYEKITALFKKHGLSFSVIGAESVMIKRISDLKLEVLPAGITSKTFVPVDAQLYLGGKRD